MSDIVTIVNGQKDNKSSWNVIQKDDTRDFIYNLKNLNQSEKTILLIETGEILSKCGRPDNNRNNTTG